MANGGFTLQVSGAYDNSTGETDDFTANGTREQSGNGMSLSYDSSVEHWTTNGTGISAVILELVESTSLTAASNRARKNADKAVPSIFALNALYNLPLGKPRPGSTAARLPSSRLLSSPPSQAQGRASQ